MAQVCRTWLEIIKGTPELWAHIRDQHLWNANLALRKSQSHPFEIIFKRVPFNEPLFNAVLEHSHRWRGASIWAGPGNVEALRKLEEISVPILQDFLLDLFTKNIPIVLDLFRDHSPKLTSLVLVWVAMSRWNSPIFGSHLHTLILVNITAFGPTRDELRGIFCACPKLTHSELTRVAFSSKTSEVLLSGSRVKLPLLHKLLLIPTSSTDVMDIAKMAEIPRCRYYSVSKLIDISGVALQVQEPFAARIASCHSLEIQLECSWTRIFCYDSQNPSLGFKLELYRVGSYKNLVDWLNSILLARRPLIPIDIDIEYQGRPPSPSDLVHLSGVRSLTIMDPCCYTKQLINALSIPRDLEDGSNGWPWPSLRPLAVKAFKRSSETFLHMVKTRTEAVAATHQRGSTGMNELVMLERFEVKHSLFTKDEFESVKAILGDAAFIHLETWNDS
ncbi:hypothetical protein FRB93_006334 [Tulasnella sp. JGI-2019a]|nr:hypothetical protein FRB93_006334 [Tulasnella sp. JGI-2019a]